MKNQLIITLDGLHIGYSGCYGNTWLKTSGLDRLAAMGCVYDRVYASEMNPPEGLRKFWGRGPISFPESSQTVLITDDPIIAELRESQQFSQVFLLEHSPPEKVASSLEETLLAAQFTEIMNHLEQLEAFSLWIHLKTLTSCWDAPLEMREAQRDEGDPPAYDGVKPLECYLDEDHDPDELLTPVQAYAAQIQVLDACVDALLEFLADKNMLKNTLILLGSLRGYPLGEHNRIGFSAEKPWRLHNEQIHLPWIFYHPDKPESWLTRNCALMIPEDFSLLLSGEHISLRQKLIITDFPRRAILSGSWFYTESSTEMDHTGALYLKPDDWWELNDVSCRCKEEIEKLRS